MDVLVAAVRRTRNQYSWMAVPVTGLGLGMLVGGTAAGEPMTTRVLCGVFGALFAAFGLAIGRLAYTMRNPERAPVVTLVKERPQEVAWIYVQQIDSQAAGVSVRKTHNVKVANVDGKTYTLAVASDQIEGLLTLLSQASPQAAGGYSKELEAQYKQEPRSVMKSL